MKEDVLEQLLDDFLLHQGYFTSHSLRFKPHPIHPEFNAKEDSVTSDVDVIALHPTKIGPDRVVVASCKAWQGGFDPASKLIEIEQHKKAGGREAWRGFRELVKPKWSESFVASVEAATGSTEFTYWTVVTRLRGKNAQTARTLWEQHPPFRAAIGGNPLRIVTLQEILDSLWAKLTTTTPAASQIGRALQLMRASGWTPTVPPK